jgi:hypothetical protein
MRRKRWDVGELRRILIASEDPNAAAFDTLSFRDNDGRRN